MGLLDLHRVERRIQFEEQDTLYLHLQIYTLDLSLHTQFKRLYINIYTLVDGTLE